MRSVAVVCARAIDYSSEVDRMWSINKIPYASTPNIGMCNVTEDQKNIIN